MLIDILKEIAGPIGAAAWLAPWIYSLFSKPKLNARLVSYCINDGLFNNEKYLIIFLRLDITSLNSAFNIMKTDINVYFSDSSRFLIGELFWARENIWTGPDFKRYKLQIEPEDTIPFFSTIPKNSTKKVYLTFKLDKSKLEKFTKIQIIFEDHFKNKSLVKIRFPENETKILWDDRIWKEL